MRKLLTIGLLFASMGSWAAGGPAVPLEHVNNNLRDKASLQRGAQIYMNKCQACHSLQYTRYNQVGEYIGALDEEGNVLEDIIQANLNFVTDKVTDKIHNSMPAEDGAKWFGVNPPDLTLVTRTRGKHWVYSYLKAFYVDESRPWGVNNTVFPDVGMPHVLLDMQGYQEPILKTVMVQDGDKQIEKQEVTGLKLVKAGQLNAEQYDRAMTDLVNFLEYVGEPAKEKRTRMGVFVILFLVILTSFLYALKREFWKDVH